MLPFSLELRKLSKELKYNPRRAQFTRLTKMSRTWSLPLDSQGFQKQTISLCGSHQTGQSWQQLQGGGLRESWAGCRGAISLPAGLLVLPWGLVPLSAQRSMVVFCLLCLYHLSGGGRFFCFNEILMKSHSVLTLSEYFYFIRVLTDKYCFMKLVSVLYVGMRERVCVTEGGRWEI